MDILGRVDKKEKNKIIFQNKKVLVIIGVVVIAAIVITGIF